MNLRSRKNDKPEGSPPVEPMEEDVPPLPALPEPLAASTEEQNSPTQMAELLEVKVKETKDEEPDTKVNASSSSNTSTHRRRNTSQHQWNEKFTALKEYKQLHGHVNVPKTYHQLGRFVNNQRQFYRRRMVDGEKNSLTDERIQALEELGFVWSMKPISVDRAKNLQTQWEQRIHGEVLCCLFDNSLL